MSNNSEKVSGIGGIFFRVSDPERMSAWYRNNLGICVEDGHADFVWRDNDRPGETGRTVWSIFPADTDYFGPCRPVFMINYRVSNLERLLAQLRHNRVAVEKTEAFDYGRFAWITDPEGNRIELWEESHATTMNDSVSPEKVVQRQLDAFNARDLDALLAVYAEDAEIFEHPAQLLARGSAALRERYGARFKEPNLHAELLRRIVMGTVVVDHERVRRTFPEGTGELELVMTYEVREGRIARAWSIIGTKTLDLKS